MPPNIMQIAENKDTWYLMEFSLTLLQKIEELADVIEATAHYVATSTAKNFIYHILF
jgi:hypothetical protein